MPVSRAGVLAGVLALLAPVIALALVPASPAAASLGSVPAEVAAYASDGTLVAELQRLYGPGKHGTGTDFDDTTKTGPVSRVYEWTDDRYAHADSDHPIQLTNYWTVPITIGGAPVGVAAIGIDPQDSLPELAEFTRSPELATALAAVPADAALVHDAESAAWYAVKGGTATPLVPGRSGVTSPTPVDELALRPVSPAPAPGGGDASTGIGLAIGVLVLLVIVIVVALVVLSRKPGTARTPRLSRTPRTFGEAEAPRVEPEPEPERAPEPEPERAPEPEPAPVPAPKPAPRKTTAATPRTPVTQKPPVTKPAASKPATKPPVAKPPASKPPTARPTTSKPLARKPRPPKPPAEDA